MFLEHINLTVADLDRSIGFYTRLFGFDIRWKGTTADGRPAAHIGNDRHYLALFQARPASRDATLTPVAPGKSYNDVGFNHAGFVVEDLEGLTRRLEELGIHHTAEQSYDPGRHVYFHDPDGIEIELVQYAPGESPVPGRVGEMNEPRTPPVTSAAVA
jgi:catechol 2,3-dioxygenase-like lactoylglutathione lyase family enzyme